MSNQQGSYYTNNPRRDISNIQKRQILWNIIEPGDPYDIKKSMIAKLPGHRKTFMGQHLELVCLLQAAEIERLCQYLDEYKLKYREVERRQLDRHSYEIQIKQLTLQLGDDNTYRAQNLKLRDFLKKQTMELQQLKKKQDDQIFRKYNDALAQISHLLNQNQFIKNQNDNLIRQINQYASKISAQQAARKRQISLFDNNKLTFDRQKRQLTMKFQTQINRLQFDNKRLADGNDIKNRQIEQLQHKIRQIIRQYEVQKGKNQNYTVILKTNQEFESRLTIAGKQIERLNFVLREKAGQLNQIYSKYRQLEADRQRADLHNKQLQNKIKNLEGINSQSQQQIRQLKNQLNQLNQAKRIIQNYESKIQMLSKQIQRLNEVLKKKLQQNNTILKKLNQYQYQFRNADLLKRQLQESKRNLQQFGQVRKKLAEYQSRLPLLSTQIQKLNNLLRSKIETISHLQNKVKSLSQLNQGLRGKINDIQNSVTYQLENKIIMLEETIKSYTIQMDQLRKKLKQSIQKNRIIVEYENRLKMLSQQVQRLNNTLRIKLEQLNRSQQRSKNIHLENQSYRRKISELEILNNQLNSKINSYEQRMGEYNRKFGQHENKIALLSQQIQRLNQVIKNKIDELNNLQQKNRHIEKRKNDIQITITQQWKSKILIYEQKLTNQSQENEQLRRKLKQVGQIQRKIIEYESKIINLSQQVDRLNGLLQKYANQNNGLNKRVIEIQQLRLAVNSLQQQLNKSNNDNKYIIEQNKGLQEANRGLTQKLNQLTLMLNQLGKQNDDLRKKLSDSGQVNRKLLEYENKIALLVQQVQRLNRIIRDKLNQLNQQQRKSQALQQDLNVSKRKIGQLENQILYQWKTKVTNYEQKISIITQQNSQLSRRLKQVMDLNRKLGQYESKIALLSQQVQRLNFTLRAKIDQANSFQQRNRMLQQQLQMAKRKISQIGMSFNNQWQLKVTAYEQQLQSFNQDNEELRRKLKQSSDLNKKIVEYQNKIMFLSQQLQRINLNLKSKVQQLTNSQLRNRSLVQQIQKLKNRINQIQSTVSIEIKTKISNYQQQISSLLLQNQQLRRIIKELQRSQAIIPEYQNRLGNLANEIERLNNSLRFKVEEINGSQKNLRYFQLENQNLKSKIVQIEISMKNQLANTKRMYDQKILFLGQENQEIKRKVKQLIQINKKLSQNESKLILLPQQIQRLNQIIKLKAQQINGYEQRQRNLQQQLDLSRRRLGQLQLSITQQWKSKILIYEQKLTNQSQENEQLRRKLKQVGQIQRKIIEYESKIINLSQQVDRLNGLLQKYANQNNGLNKRVIEIQQLRLAVNSLQQQLNKSNNDNKYIIEQNKGLQEANRGLTQKLNQLTLMLNQLGKQNDDLRKKLSDSGQVNRKLLEYENKIALLVQQVQRLNRIIRDKLNQLNQQQRKSQALQQDLNVSKRKIGQLENQILYQWKTKVTNYEQKISIITQQNSQLSRRLKQVMDLNRKLGQYESKIALLSQQVQRLNFTLRAKIDQANSFQQRNRMLQQQLQMAKRKISQIGMSFNNQWQLKVTAYEQQLQSFNQDNEELRRKLKQSSDLNKKIVEYQNKIMFLSQQLQRVNKSFKQKNDQWTSFQFQYRNTQNQLHIHKKLVIDLQNQINFQWKSKLVFYQQQISKVLNQNEQCKKKIKQLSDSNRRISELQNKLGIVNQQIQRLNHNLRIKVQQLSSADQKNRSFQQEIEQLRRQISQIQYSKVGSYQQKITLLIQQNQQVKRNLKQLYDKNRQLSLYESKTLELSKQLERLNQIIRSKVQQINSCQIKFRNCQQQNENLKRKLNEMQNSIIYDFQQKINLSQQKIHSLKLQQEQYRKKIKQLTDHNRKLIQLEPKIAILSQEIERLNQNLKIKVQQVNNYEYRLRSQQQQIDVLKRKLQDLGNYQNRYASLSQQVDRLNSVLRQFSQKNYVLNAQLENSKRKDSQYLSDIQRLNNTLRLKVQQSSRWQTEYNDLLRKCDDLENRFNIKQNDYQKLNSNYMMILNQYENSKKHLVQYQHSIKKLYAQFERLQSIMQQLKKQNYNLKTESQKSQSKNRVLSAQIDRLNLIIQKLKEQISEVRINLTDQAALERKINQQLALLVVLFAEIQSLRKRVKDKQKEVQDVRRSSLAPFKV